MKYSPKPSWNSVKMPLTVISRVEMGVKNWSWSKEINNTDWICNFQTVTIKKNKLRRSSSRVKFEKKYSS